MCSRKQSEPIPCPSKNNEKRRNIDYVDIKDIEKRLKTAAMQAKEELSQGKDLQSCIFITDHKKCSIVVNELKKNDLTYLVVYKNEGGKSKTLFKEEKNRWRFVFFKNINESRIFINCKLLKIMFEDCTECILSLRYPIIGSCDFLRCKNINLNIKMECIPSSFTEYHPPIPYTRIELCNDFSVVQSPSILIYIVNSSHNISGTIVDYQSGIRYAQHDLGGKLFWDEQEQIIISFSKKEGFVSAPYHYALNDISNHIIIKPIDENDIDDTFYDDLGTTPPVSESFK